MTRAPQKGGTGTGSSRGHAAAAVLRIGDIDRGEAARVGGAERAAFVARLAAALGLHRGEVVVEAVAGDLVHQVQPVEGIPRIGDAAASAIGIGADAVVLDIVAGQRGAAEQHRHLDALALHLLQVLAHHHGGLHQQAGHADGMRPVLLRRRHDVGKRHLDAEVDHPVAVVGEDDVDQVLADVVHVALHRGQHDGALLLALDLLHEGLEIGDGRLHRLGRLQHEGQLHLAGAEQLAHHLHAVQQHVVDDGERRVALVERGLQFLVQALAVAIDDAVLEPALDRLGALHLAMLSAALRPANISSSFCSGS